MLLINYNLLIKRSNRLKLNCNRPILKFLLLFLLFSSCKKFVQIPLPSDQLTAGFVFTNDNSAIQALDGIYSKMMEDQQQFSSGFTTFFTGLSSGELYYYTPSFRDEFSKDQISIANHPNIESDFWAPCYRYIYAANKCIEEAANSKNLSSDVKNTVIGEAKFIRAFCYFHLVNLFGDVPLILSTVYQENQSMLRTSEVKVYSQIIADLKDAKNSLTASYNSDKRIRPNKFAATALLARVDLYNNDWVHAEKEASEVINSGIYNLDENLNNVFEIFSKETIWQLQPVDPSVNTWEGNQILPSSPGSTPTYLLTSNLLNSFEANDQRKSEWVKSDSFSNQAIYYPYKYKVNSGTTVTEYYIVLRLAEQYLIRAEARANENNITGAQNDLNIIRNRAGLSDIISNDQTSLLKAIAQEGRVEFFAEWGHRWYDLKRRHEADSVLGKINPDTWQSTDTLWPIPESQIRLNPALTQNAGY